MLHLILRRGGRLVLAAVMATMAMQPAKAHDQVTLDHIIWLVPDLDAGAAHFAAQSGVTPSIGGVHPGIGTANQLAAIAPATYLEILGPDPAQGLDTPRGPVLRMITTPQILTFAVASHDLDNLAARARLLGLTPSTAIAGSRTRPDGVTLAWRRMMLESETFGPLVPFVIDWRESPHPAASSAPGATLRALRAIHPDAGRLQAIYNTLGVPVRAEEGDTPALILELETPQGPVTLRSGAQLLSLWAKWR